MAEESKLADKLENSKKFSEEEMKTVKQRSIKTISQKKSGRRYRYKSW